MRYEPAERVTNYVREGRKMPFTPPKPEDLKGYSAAGINDLRTHAETELTALRASVTPDTVTDEQLDQMEGLKSFIAAADVEVDERKKRAERFSNTDVPARPEPETVVADAEPEFDDNGDKDVKTTTAAVDVANSSTEIVDATVTAAGATGSQARRSVQVADVAPHAPVVDIPEGDAGPGYTIVAAADIANTTSGSTLDWLGVGKAFEERVHSYPSVAKSGMPRARMQHPLARIRRDFPENQIVFENDGHEVAFNKLRDTADAYGREPDAVLAANGWCAPSEPDYSICSPISADGLWSGPEQVLRRGGLIHNRGLDFGDFFGDDFVLPIPGYNILTEAQVIADTAKTCVEIPCPAFVDDRLNVAALCLTSSLLQNRGYPEFVAEFTRGAVAAMAHLVNREVINAIATGSVAVPLLTVDPWVTDGTFYSNLLSAVEFAVKDMRYIYRAPMTTRFDVVLPYWTLAAMRADYIRQNARASDDLADATIAARFSERGANVQWVYDWQDAFNPGAIPATNQMGNATPPFNYPTSTQFLVYLPGTWVLGRQDVIRLDTVYDSTNLQQNLVTQLFMEDGFIPMRMCQHSRLYSIPTCANGSTGVQRAITCTDVTP
jgi:hypothetical protein